MQAKHVEAAYKAGDIDAIISVGAQNPLIPNCLRLINARVIQLHRYSLSSKERMTTSIHEIHLIMDAITRRDEDAAFKASMGHIQEAAKAGIEKLSREAELKLAEKAS